MEDVVERMENEGRPCDDKIEEGWKVGAKEDVVERMEGGGRAM